MKLNKNKLLLALSKANKRIKSSEIKGDSFYLDIENDFIDDEIKELQKQLLKLKQKVKEKKLKGLLP